LRVRENALMRIDATGLFHAVIGRYSNGPRSWRHRRS
jgi:hypothetical protein